MVSVFSEIDFLVKKKKRTWRAEKKAVTHGKFFIFLISIRLVTFTF